MNRSLRRCLLLLALLAPAACSRTATFNVVRPAILNASAVGNTMTVGPIAAPNPIHLPAAADISAQLQHRIANSLNRSIRLVAAGGGVVITGAVLANDYAETMERNNRVCSRQVQSGTANGVPQYRTDTYACVDLRRVGTGVSRVQFQITHGSDGTVFFDQVYEFRQQEVTTGVMSSYENRTPAYINPDALTAAARAVNIEHFARVILPWQEQVTVVFEDCNGDARCRQGYDLVQQGNLEAAEPLFTQVIGDADRAGAAVPASESERIGEAFFNRGLTREYLGRYTQAVADLQRAMQLRPDESDWQTQLEEAQQMARDQEALRQQGAVSNETQNVQRAGTP